jgi:hypothetical protein
MPDYIILEYIMAAKSLLQEAVLFILVNTAFSILTAKNLTLTNQPCPQHSRILFSSGYVHLETQCLYRSVDVKQGGGQIGQIVLRSLLSASHLKTTALKRPGSTSTFPTAPNLKVVESDFTPESLVSIFRGQDAVISVVGLTGFDKQKGYVDAAVEAGVKRFFPSEFGINGQSKVVQQLTPFFTVKQELLDYLVEREKDGLTWTGLIVGVLLDWVRHSLP